MVSSSGARLDLRKARVLIVDDNATSLELITQIMTGFRVRQLKGCRSAEEARALVATDRFDLLLVDFEMPGEDGPSLVEHIRSEARQPNHTVPIVILSSSTTSYTVTRARDAGASMVVRKPVAPAILLSRIEWIARNNRDFVSSGGYCGPDRRFKTVHRAEDAEERRASAAALIADPTRAMSQDEISSLFG